MFWPNTTFTRDQVLSAARWIRPASSFRSSYAYNNLMFVVVGEVIHSVSGLSYDDFIRTRSFAPLEMTEARISNHGLTESDNTAVPHSRGWRLEGTLKPIAWTRDDVWAAAAGVKASVTDLAKWMRVQLAQGQIRGAADSHSRHRRAGAENILQEPDETHACRSKDEGRRFHSHQAEQDVDQRRCADDRGRTQDLSMRTGHAAPL